MNNTVDQWKNEVMSDRKVEVIKDIHKLELQIQAMEREKGTHIYSKRGEFYTDFQQLYELEMMNVDERLMEKDKLKQQLGRISLMVHKFERDLQGAQPTTAFVQRLKSTLEDVESTINTYKEQQRQRYEELMGNERMLSHEVGALQLKYDSWAQRSSAPQQKVATTGASSARDVTVDLPEDVAHFENFVQKTGGARGGWDEFDHQTFLKLWLRHKNKVSQLFESLRSSIPTKNDQQISDHVTWYREYLRLDGCKKLTIQEWRRNKQIEKELISEKCDDDDKDVGEIKRVQSEEVTNRERGEKMAKLNAWKVEREIERMSEEEQTLRMELDQKRRAAEERQRQLDVKSGVLEYKRQRDEDEAFLEQQREAWDTQEWIHRKQLSAREGARFRQRDEQKLKSKKLQKQHLLEEEQRKKENLNKIKEEVRVTRDPSRLYQPTEGWKCRVSDKQTNPSTPAIHLPHRAIPSWRQNIT